MGKKTCLICGINSGPFPLCYKHYGLIKEGKVIKNDKGEWLEVQSENIIENYEDDSDRNKRCILCDDLNANGICDDCSTDIDEKIETIYKHRDISDLRQNYFNLEGKLFNNEYQFEVLVDRLRMLMALAFYVEEEFNDTSLTTRLRDDVVGIIESQKKLDENDDLRIQKNRNIKAKDGHLVKSEGELLIDNILYENMILHSYDKIVDKISRRERTMVADFYIPVLPDKGIYIEYWGRTDADYTENRSEKTVLYDKYELELINIEKDDKNDPTTLEVYLLREIVSRREKILESDKKRFLKK